MEKLAFYGVIAGLGAAVIYLLLRGLPGAAKDAGRGLGGAAVGAVFGLIEGAYEAVPDWADPVSDKNLVYQTESKIIQLLPGSSRDETLGTWIYGLTHPFEKF